MNKSITSTLLALVLLTGLRAQDTSMQAAFSKSYVLEKNQSYAGAIDALKSWYNESNYALNIRLGYLCYLAGRNAESVSYYEHAILLKPTSIEARLGYTLPAAILAKWDDVVKQYQAILAIEPNNSYVNYKLGYIYYYRKNYLDALKHFGITANLYPFDYGSVLMTGWSTYFLGKKEEARVLFERVLLISPYDKSALEGLSMIAKN